MSRPATPIRRTIPALAVLLAGCQTLPIGEPEPHRAVLTALEADGEAQVVVALVSPAGHGEPDADAEEVRSEISRLQSEVLASVSPRDFQLRHRFETIAALSGTILTRRGLRDLLAHPNVRAVDLDPGGTGGGDPVPPPPPPATPEGRS